VGLIDALRRTFGSHCQELIKYQSGVFDFRGLGLGYPPVNISLAGIRTGVVKLEHATQVARNLDMYQVLMCRLTHEVDSENPLREKLIRARAVALGDLTAFSNSLAAFKADPTGQGKNLNRAVREMQNFMRQVKKEIFGAEALKGEIDAHRDIILSIMQNVEEITPSPPKSQYKAADAQTWAPRYGKSTPPPPRLSREQRRAKAWADAMDLAGLKESELDFLVREISQS
jgi:dsRNA-specific ribonuclease